MSAPKIPFAQKLTDVHARYRALIEPRSESLDPGYLVWKLYAKGQLADCAGELYQLELFVNQLSDVARTQPPFVRRAGSDAPRSILHWR